MKQIVAALLILVLAGCAANVKQVGPAGDLRVPAGSKETLVVTFQGNQKVNANPDWGRIKSAWRSALQSEASTHGYSLSERARPALGVNSLQILIDVSNFRYLTPAMRYNFGVMTGNAWVDAKVSFVDLGTGRTLGSRTYNTSSSAWEGVFSAMTEEQLQALSAEIINTIRGASVYARPEPAPAEAHAASKEERLNALTQQNLPYEEYMKRRREIMAE